MPDGSGFDVLKHFKNPNFEVIFTTAYENYALDAFKANALHYLVKPINIKDLEIAIGRYLKHKGNRIQNSIPVVTHPSSIDHVVDNKVNIPISEGFNLIEANNILKIQSSGSSSIIWMVDKSSFTSNKLLKYFEEILPSNMFFRINKSMIINTNHIVTYIKGRGGEVHLSDGSIEDVASRRKIDFLQALSHKGTKILKQLD